MFREMEFWIEDVIGGEQIRTKQKKFYKGTPKKWQVLDDNAHDRDQIELMQQATQAPMPEELERYEEAGKVPLYGPIHNE